MTPSTIELAVDADDLRIARLAAAAVGLALVDATIPMPLPGVKPGIANIVTLMVLARYGWRVAAWVSLLRVMACALLLGQFLAPGFFLSLSGTLMSLLVLAPAMRLPARWFGVVSWSLLASFAHIAGQLMLARLWLVPHDGIFRLTPIFLLAALVFGIMNGLVAARLLRESALQESRPGKETACDA
ncbi:MAG: Gx transporter family protein [Zoogloeaceae bacterium]|jgi:heptaprenyl diphosphate synthase|nr:Gx transporter family protein [Zoogloeaceae bacterium]